MMILALGSPTWIYVVFGTLLWLLYVLVPAALVLPGVLAQWRYGAALLSVVLGVCIALTGLLPIVRDWEEGEQPHWVIVMVGVYFALVILVGCYGMWRWFRLPRR